MKRRYLNFNLKNSLIIIEGFLVILFVIFLLLSSVFKFLTLISFWLGLISIWFGIFSLMITLFMLFHKQKDTYNLSEFRGEGSIDNPIIIESIETFPEPFKMNKSKSHITIRKCNLSSAILYKCQNITIEVCKINFLDLKSCSDIKIRKTSIHNELYLSTCKNNEIIDCNVGKLTMNISYNNLIQNCKIQIIENEFSKGNIFEKNEIPNYELIKLNREDYKKGIDFCLIYFLILLVLSFVMFLISMTTFDDIYSIFIFTFVLIITSTSVLSIVLYPMISESIRDIKEKKLLKQYPKNKLIK